MLERLNAHRAWANRVYLEWQEARPERDAYVLKMFSHVLRAEEAWLTRLRGGTPENRIWDVVAASDLAALLAANDAGLHETIAGGAATLGRVFRYNRFDGTPMESAGSDIIAHVLCLHGMHHRAQIAAHASRADLAPPPATDFIVFARLFP